MESNCIFCIPEETKETTENDIERCTCTLPRLYDYMEGNSNHLGDRVGTKRLLSQFFQRNFLPTCKWGSEVLQVFVGVKKKGQMWTHETGGQYLN